MIIKTINDSNSRIDMTLTFDEARILHKVLGSYLTDPFMFYETNDERQSIRELEADFRKLDKLNSK